ncbi:MAG: hypothetical protein QM484_13330 [Woeseiaceae bacterium]
MKMTATIKQFKKLHPEIYQALIYQGVMIERERVLAHLKVAGVYDCLHDCYALIEDQRDELERIAATQCR